MAFGRDNHDCNHWDNCPTGDNISVSITCQSTCMRIFRLDYPSNNNWCMIVDIYEVKAALIDNIYSSKN